ncbi:CDP-glucose 4,6-dehydratase [Dyadobacter arcticus]|uniref:CDP-glucose 4,6-dehydratase n=1 Tax=Dyadobacter arcticus TaxID=1078754 RepID=A0ABX0UJJ9_9BACT|nr:CDP-glucose 4,6-dehydratase [Dyadobacter arcticus]NIJ51575.1 CDP-glucose 4,6-dehydratase [Dyadobacter arcticus]
MDYQHLTHYYKGKRVFLTGHTGFKGSWLLNWLYLLGADIKGYSLAPLNDFDLFNAIEGDNMCVSVIGNILDREHFLSEILSFEPDYIFHLAAQPLVRLSYEVPSETFSVNAIGTAHLMDAVRLLKQPCNVILITTDKVYENKEWHYPYREIDRLGGYDPYSASKACAEIIISSYRNSFFNSANYSIHRKAIASARAGNVIGGGDWAQDRIIPDIVRALLKNDKIVVRNPYSIRPWQHVLEPLGGYLHLGTKMTENPILYSDSWNFGPLAEDNLTVESLVKISLSIWGNGNYETPVKKEELHEAGLLKLDINKAMNILKWKPKYNARGAIEKTLEWYKIFENGESISSFTQYQISEFINAKS